MRSNRHSNGIYQATQMRENRTPRNHTMVWRISAVRAPDSGHYVQTSQVEIPGKGSETLVFPCNDAYGRNATSSEVAGGPGMSHDSAVRSYLDSLTVLGE